MRYRVAILAAVLLTLGGCRCSPASPTKSPVSETGSGAERSVVREAGDLSLTGRVRLEGPPPDMRRLPTASDPHCAQFEKLSEDVVTHDGFLQNVLVHIDGQGLPVREATTPLKLDQVECMYTPRVQCIAAGRPAEIHNSDPVMHNVHARLGGRGGRTLFNRAQMQNAPPIRETFRRHGGLLIHFGCDVHPWMEGYLFVSDTGYCAVTDADGRFEIDGLPPGTYTVTFWHERYGEQTAEVAVEAGRGGEIEVAYTSQ